MFPHALAEHVILPVAGGGGVDGHIPSPYLAPGRQCGVQLAEVLPQLVDGVRIVHEELAESPRLAPGKVLLGLDVPGGLGRQQFSACVGQVSFHPHSPFEEGSVSGGVCGLR